MRFNPKSDSELNNYGFLDEGIYNFEVTEAKDRVSKNGNDMIEVKLKVWSKEGKEHIVFDYLLEAMAFKLKHFADTAGLAAKYEAGELSADDCLGKCGKVEIFLQPGNMRPEGGYYPDKNSVKDYVMTDKGATKVLTEALLRNIGKPKEEFIDSDLPF
jgi:hypothetical protein